MSAEAVMNREFFEIRAKILELAASFDRLDRGDGAVEDRRIELIREGLTILDEDTPNRAERVQLLFSKVYSEGWRSEYGLSMVG